MEQDIAFAYAAFAAAATYATAENVTTGVAVMSQEWDSIGEKQGFTMGDGEAEYPANGGGGHASLQVLTPKGDRHESTMKWGCLGAVEESSITMPVVRDFVAMFTITWEKSSIARSAVERWVAKAHRGGVRRQVRRGEGLRGVRQGEGLQYRQGHGGVAGPRNALTF